MTRRGTALVEMLMIVGILFLMGAITGPLFVRIFRDLGDVDRMMHEAAAANAMVQSIREDMADAVAASMSTNADHGPDALMIRQADRTVCYRFEDGRWVRRLFDPAADWLSETHELDAWVMPLSYVACAVWYDSVTDESVGVEITTAVVGRAHPDEPLRMTNSHVLFLGAGGGGP